MESGRHSSQSLVRALCFKLSNHLGHELFCMPSSRFPRIAFDSKQRFLKTLKALIRTDGNIIARLDENRGRIARLAPPGLFQDHVHVKIYIRYPGEVLFNLVSEIADIRSS